MAATRSAAAGPRPFIFATLATFIAGFVDAVGYTHLGGLFLSFMSGNSTRLGLNIASWQPAVVGEAVLVIGCFVAGALIGTLIADSNPRRKLMRILAAEVVLFAVAALMARHGMGDVSLLPVAAAMGMQNAVHQLIAGADVGKSFVTGALFGIGQALARRLTGGGSLAEATSYAASWCAFIVGVVAGSLLVARAGLEMALTGGGLLLALLTVVAFVFDRHLGPAVAEYGGD